MTIVSGLHHVSCVVSDAKRLLEFYRCTLGMALVAKTVNLDETSVVQLYCGDVSGTPGSIISLLEDPGAEKAVIGSGQIGSIAFGIARGSSANWHKKLGDQGFKVDGEAWCFGERQTCLTDPDGMALALVEDNYPCNPRPGFRDVVEFGAEGWQDRIP